MEHLQKRRLFGQCPTLANIKYQVWLVLSSMLIHTLRKLNHIDLIVNRLPGLEFTAKNPGVVLDNREGLGGSLKTRRRRQPGPFYCND
jgi:hypothetical protein